VVIVAYSALSDEEREEAFTKINDARLSALAGSDEIAIFIRSLQRVADVVDYELVSGCVRECPTAFERNLK
jgi:hypothetical protein